MFGVNLLLTGRILSNRRCENSGKGAVKKWKIPITSGAAGNGRNGGVDYSSVPFLLAGLLPDLFGFFRMTTAERRPQTNDFYSVERW